MLALGLHDLRYKAGILHRDISVNNVMWEIKDGAYNFILIDFDMATVVESDDGLFSYKASSKHRTGTLPFMAFELIYDAFRGTQPDVEAWIPVAHLLRHDFESLFYLGFWCATALPDPEPGTRKEDNNILVHFAKQLEKGGLELLAHFKQNLVTSPFGYSKVTLPASLRDLRPWFTGFTTAFRESVSALKAYQAAIDDVDDGIASPSTAAAAYDFETAGGWLTRSKLKEMLDSRTPARSLARLTNPEPLTGPEPARTLAARRRAVRQQRQAAGPTITGANEYRSRLRSWKGAT